MKKLLFALVLVISFQAQAQDWLPEVNESNSIKSDALLHPYDQWLFFTDIETFMYKGKRNPMGIKHVLDQTEALLSQVEKSLDSPDYDNSYIREDVDSLRDYSDLDHVLDMNQSEVVMNWYIHEHTIALRLMGDFYGVMIKKSEE